MDQETLKNTLFPNLYHLDGDFNRAGYLSMIVSVFDHVLSREECWATNHIDYDSAVETGCVPEYMKGERSFLKLYDRLMTKGVYVMAPRTNHISFFPRKDETVNDIFVKALRYIQVMDVFFPSLQIRVQGSHGREDLFLLRDKTVLPQLEKMVHDCGLHMFPHVLPLSWEEAFPD